MRTFIEGFGLCNCFLGRDFSLLDEGDDDKDGWRQSFPCLKEPRSFRCCLEQVNQEAFEAFHLSHDKMGAIELSTKNIPGETVAFNGFCINYFQTI